MSQISFSDAEYAGKRKKTRREVFLDEMEVVVPWKALLSLIERTPNYSGNVHLRDAHPLRDLRLGEPLEEAHDQDRAVAARESPQHFT